MSAIAQQRVIGIVRTSSAATAADTCRALLAAGLSVVEVAVTTPGALQVIAELRHDAPDDAVIGAGTVLDAATARAAVLAGAEFLVSPSYDPGLLTTGHRYGVAVLPGAQTATEIVTALSGGADAVKLYPASAASPAVLRDLRAPLPQAPLIPTGGISVDTAADWITAGAVAVGLGSALTAGSPDEIAQRAGELLTRLRSASV